MPSIPLRKKETNEIFNTSLTSTQNNRYCTNCHLKLVHKYNSEDRSQKYIYTCPRCNVSANIYNTEPSERLVTTFPTTMMNTSLSPTKKYIMQSENDRLSRSKYFYKKNIEEKNRQTEVEDPYLAMLKRKNDITITNIDYRDPMEEQEDYRDEQQQY